jgi:GntR family transcriptional regulator, vanillate catabolism transcriptional regulator
LSETEAYEGRGGSQTVKALLALRDLLINGELKAGQRLSEIWAVDRLGVSRTPVRAALARLEEEGLLEALSGGGYAVKGFTELEIFDAIEIRGALEGLAARLAAERGGQSAGLLVMADSVREVDQILALPTLTDDHFTQFILLNAQFHAGLIEAAASRTLARQLERACALPFASPSGFVRAQARVPEARLILTLAQDHHRCVLEAIEAGHAERAEALMREHARLAMRNLRLAQRHAATHFIPGAALIHPA